MLGLFRYRNGGLHALVGGPLAKPVESSSKQQHPLTVFVQDKAELMKPRNPAVFAELSTTSERFVKSWSSLVNETSPLFNQEYGNLVELKNQILNIFHSFVHSIQRDDMDTHTSHMRNLKTILNDGLNQALTVNNRRNQREGISTLTQFHHRGGPGGNDPAFDRRFGFFQV